MKKKYASFTLVEVLIVLFLIFILFLALIGGYALVAKINSFLARKVTAIQIAVGEIEKIKNLPYLKVGTKNAILPFAEGELDSESSILINNFQYRIQRKVKFVSDPLDGEEDCPLDYKKVEIKVFFGRKEKDFIVLTSEIFPKTKAEEIQVCQEQPAGLLMVQVFDSKGELISNPKIEIFDSKTKEKIDEAYPSNGVYYFPLSPGEYIAKASKEGYSFERTYGVDEIAKPAKSNPYIFVGQTSKVSFSIDKLSTMEIQTLSMWSHGYFGDSFVDEEKISEKENITIQEGSAKLSSGTTQGYFFSVEILPENLSQWESFSFVAERPQGTNLKFQFYFASGTEWVLIPEKDLPGNEEGFEASPVDLSNLPVNIYSRLKVKASFYSQAIPLSPILEEYLISFRTSLPSPISNVAFKLRGEKILGEDESENLVFKFSTSTQTDNDGRLILDNLEWDIYHFSEFHKNSQSLQLVTSTPPYPVSLSPQERKLVDLYLKSEHSLFLTVVDEDSLFPVFSASVSLEGENLSFTQFTNNKGQTLFVLPESGNFLVSVSAPGYYPTSTQVYVSGDAAKLIKIKIAD